MNGVPSVTVRISKQDSSIKQGAPCIFVAAYAVAARCVATAAAWERTFDRETGTADVRCIIAVGVGVGAGGLPFAALAVRARRIAALRREAGRRQKLKPAGANVVVVGNAVGVGIGAGGLLFAALLVVAGEGVAVCWQRS